MVDVTATRHNNLQDRVERVLGDGNGDYGYGQGEGYGSTPSSYQVSTDPLSNLNIVTAADINAIYSDMLRCRVHQLGTEPAEIAELIADANIIAETESFIVDNDGISVVDPDGAKKGLVDFENLMTSIETDRFLLHASQAALEPGISSLRTSAWNKIITHEFTVTFNNSNHRRHFFNAGGQIRISAAVINPIGDKALSWLRFFESFGVIIFDYTSTRSSTIGSGTQIGNYDLTASYQTVFTSTGTGYTNAVYNGNLYRIEARAPNFVNSSNQGETIQFKITMNDVAVDNLVDNFIVGSTNSEIQVYRANSQYVTVPAPSFITNTSLTVGGT